MVHLTHHCPIGLCLPNAGGDYEKDFLSKVNIRMRVLTLLLTFTHVQPPYAWASDKFKVKYRSGDGLMLFLCAHS